MALKYKQNAESRDPKQGYQRNDAKHGGTAGHDESSWLVSYADMMTLLCGFFILLYSTAKIDPPKYEQIKEQLAKQFNGPYAEPSTKELGNYLQDTMKTLGLGELTTVKSDPTSVTISFQSTLFFDSLSAEVRPQGDELITRVMNKILEKQKTEGKQYNIVIEGHTDSRPILGGNFPSNWELSSARASHVVRKFLQNGFAPDHLAAIGYADTRPEVISRNPAGELDEAALSRNRRVVVRVLEPSVPAIPFAELPVKPANPAH